jgi:hypothetical protein
MHAPALAGAIRCGMGAGNGLRGETRLTRRPAPGGIALLGIAAVFVITPSPCSLYAD